jgi:hypothetical protein
LDENQNNFKKIKTKEIYNMVWTLELASYLDDAPWPANKAELIDYAQRTGAPQEVIENLRDLEDNDEPYETIEEIWLDYPTKEDFFYDDEEKDF